MDNSTFYNVLNLLIKQLFCLVLIFNVVGKTFVVDILHESIDYFELCDSNPEEKELDCKEKEVKDYDEEEKFFADTSLNFKHADETIDLDFYRDNQYFGIHSSIVLPPPEGRS